MKADSFRSWLMNTYVSERTGEHLSKAAASNALSRCKRVERRLSMNLDRELDRLGDGQALLRHVRGSVEKFNIDGDEYTGIASILSDVRLYALFCDWERKVFRA